MYVFDKVEVDYENFTDTEYGEQCKIYRFSQVGINSEIKSKIYSIKFRKLLKYQWYVDLQIWIMKMRKKTFVQNALGREYHG